MERDPTELQALRWMILMRHFEQRIGEAVTSGEIHGEMHLALGQEAIAAGLAFLLTDGDAVVSTHRPHLHALALGVDPVDMLAELLERDGLCRGKGGHMHLFDPGRGFMCTGIVGAGVPIAAGYALARRNAGDGAVTIAVTGDGGMNQGGVLETLNLAALWRLPLIFLCEDNGYGISVSRERASAGDFVTRGEAFNIPSVQCDGTDPLAVRQALEEPFARARRGEGPSLVVASAYRYSGHYEGDADQYRPRNEKTAARSEDRDPIMRLRGALVGSGTRPQDLDQLEAEVEQLLDTWFLEARSRPLPPVDQVLADVFA